MEPTTFAWSWRAAPVPVGYELSGAAGAEPILMLPAMSTVSTRDELRALAHHLEPRRCIVTDWPGFGDTARPRLDYNRALCRGFLEALVAHLQGKLKRPSFPVIACGHAAGYAVDLEARQPGTFTHLVLIAPTWRGPLPTMMSGRKPIQGRIRKLIHAPVIGELLYRLNVSQPVVRVMYRRHVFADPAFLPLPDAFRDRCSCSTAPTRRLSPGPRWNRSRPSRGSKAGCSNAARSEWPRSLRAIWHR
jgi:pimeloyl-ACP methyl ester carboxylesterase